MLFHDHFIGEPGGVALFYLEGATERDALLAQRHLADWRVEHQPLIYAFYPAAFDEQIAYTLRAYRNCDWSQLRKARPLQTRNP